MENLLETYKKRLAVSENVYSQRHTNSFDDNKKLTIARVLKNTSALLGESFTSSNGTQRSDLGEYKKFCL